MNNQPPQAGKLPQSQASYKRPQRGEETEPQPDSHNVRTPKDRRKKPGAQAGSITPERISTIQYRGTDSISKEAIDPIPPDEDDEKQSVAGQPQPQPQPAPHTGMQPLLQKGQRPPLPWQTTTRKSPPRSKKQPVAWCLTACCIFFWLLVIAVGLTVLIIYLLYHPQPPRLRVATATLNAGYLDKMNGGIALNSDLTVLATIYNPNTKVDVVLHRMELDLLFQGNLIATQAVWPAPLHEGPGGSVLRSVHLVVSEVTMTQEDVLIWQNATSNGGPVQLQLIGRFQTQLNFGRWLRYTYWVYPSCNLKLDPPPSGALNLPSWPQNAPIVNWRFSLQL